MEWYLALTGAAWLGIQTSISPCPLATNIAAISFIGRRVSSPTAILFSGVLYTLGRTLAYLLLVYLVLGVMIVSGNTLALFLQKQVHQYLGPPLILIGMMLVGLLSFNFGSANSEKMTKLVDSLGIWSALPLGAVFAVAFCPTSAATFLATVMLCSQQESPLLLPGIYGIGTALPVLLFAGIIAFQTHWLGKAFQILSQVDWWMRNVTGTLFIVLGLWFSLRYIFHLPV